MASGRDKTHQLVYHLTLITIYHKPRYSGIYNIVLLSYIELIDADYCMVASVYYFSYVLFIARYLYSKYAYVV